MTRAVLRHPHDEATPTPRIDMTTQLAGIDLPGPVLTASGCAAAGKELDQFFDITAIGAVVTKSIMMEPRSGRATPRMAETPGGTTQEFEAIAHVLRQHDGFDAIEVNISCPNVSDRGQVFACRADSAAGVIASVRRASDPAIPIFAKLSPDVTDIATIAQACERAGADGLSLINTTLGMVIDVTTMRPALAGVTGGLSGPAIRPIAVRCLWQVREVLPDIPIIGMGGIRNGSDAFEFILAGASAVSVGTTVFHDPSAPIRIQNELASLAALRGFTRLRDAVSYAHRDPDQARVEDADGDLELPEWV